MRGGLTTAAAHAKDVKGADRPLTDLQRRFVDVLLIAAEEGSDLADWEAAKIAGYAGTDRDLRSQAAQARRKPQVRAAIAEGIAQGIRHDLPLHAYRQYAKLARKQQPDSLSVAASGELLRNAGFLSGSSQGAQSGGVTVVIAAPGFDLAAYAAQGGDAPQIIEHDQPLE